MAKKVTESSGNVFLDLGFQPHEAEVMLLRAKLAEALRAWIEREDLCTGSGPEAPRHHATTRVRNHPRQG